MIDQTFHKYIRQDMATLRQEIKETNSRFDSLEEKTTARIDAMAATLTARIDALFNHKDPAA